MTPKEVPPFLLSGIPVVAVPPNCPFQGCGSGCCCIAKVRLSFGRADIHMMASHPNAFEWDQRRGHAAFPLAKELAAKIVSPAEGKCQLKGNPDGRGRATTDLSQTFPQLGQTDILTAHQIPLPGTSELTTPDMRPCHVLPSPYVQSPAHRCKHPPPRKTHYHRS